MQVVDSISYEHVMDHRKRDNSSSPSSFTVRRVSLGDHIVTLKQWHGSRFATDPDPWHRFLGINMGIAGSVTSVAILSITLDLRGHGDSTKPTSGFLFDDFVSDLESVLNTLGIDHPLLIGHSFGGLVALGWAAKHPDRSHRATSRLRISVAMESWWSTAP